MPTPYVTKLADEHGMSVSEAERRWAKAKKVAEKEGRGEDYAYITGIFKKMMGETSMTALVARLKATEVASNDDFDRALAGFRDTEERILELVNTVNTPAFKKLFQDLDKETGGKSMALWKKLDKAIGTLDDVSTEISDMIDDGM